MLKIKSFKKNIIFILFLWKQSILQEIVRNPDSVIPYVQLSLIKLYYLEVTTIHSFVNSLGAVGDTGKYNITSDVFIGDLTLKKWKK